MDLGAIFSTAASWIGASLHVGDRESGDDTAKPTEKRQELEREVTALDKIAKDAIDNIEKSA
jgi:hypothetical protein